MFGVIKWFIYPSVFILRNYKTFKAGVSTVFHLLLSICAALRHVFTVIVFTVNSSIISLLAIQWKWPDVWQLITISIHSHYNLMMHIETLICFAFNYKYTSVFFHLILMGIAQWCSAEMCGVFLSSFLIISTSHRINRCYSGFVHLTKYCIPDFLHYSTENSISSCVESYLCL